MATTTVTFNDTVKRAFIAFYLETFRKNDLDALDTLDGKHQVPEFNHYLELAPRVSHETLLEDVLNNRSEEMITLLTELAAKYPEVATFRSCQSWRDWYLSLINQISARTSRD